MGFNTAAIILNDQLHQLAKDPDAGEWIARAVRDSRGDGSTPFGLTVLSSAHSDTIQIVGVGGNMIQRLGYGRWDDKPEDLLRKLADQMGFRLVRKAARPDQEERS